MPSDDSPGLLDTNPELFDILNHALGTMHYHRLMSALNSNGYQLVRDAVGGAIREPCGLANLRAIVADQPFQNSALSVFEISLILDNEGGFMPDEAVAWFRGARGTFGSGGAAQAGAGASEVIEAWEQTVAIQPTHNLVIARSFAAKTIEILRSLTSPQNKRSPSLGWADPDSEASK